jgi:hypothetical protein
MAFKCSNTFKYIIAVTFSHTMHSLFNLVACISIAGCRAGRDICKHVARSAFRIE